MRLYFSLHYMADLMIDEEVFTPLGSAYFKRRIQEKKVEIQQGNNIVELKMEQRALEGRQLNMNYYLSIGGFTTMHGILIPFGEHQKGIYTMYRNDISELLTQVKNRLLELEGAHGMRKRTRIRKRKSRRKSNGGRKLTNKRKAYTRSH